MIANVYQDGQWMRVEHFHPDCYDAMGQPYGPPAKPAGTQFQSSLIEHD